jgi:CheY-like chemotaxis protein
VDDREGAQDRTYALVVEDDAVNQRVTKMMLEKMGCVVDVASSGPEAIELFETRVYDLVLVDCRMPGMDGYETTAALRRMEGDERHTPIVAITADTSEGVRERCLEAGMDAYIAKPVHAEDLQHAIDKLLNASLPDREPAPPGQIDEVLDRRALLARVAGNTEVLRSLANLCQAECNRLMSEIREAIKTGDRAEFLRATHKLRGSIMSMEARAAVDAVQRLELTANQGRPADAEEMLDQLRRELDRLITAMYALIDEADDGGDSP